MIGKTNFQLPYFDLIFEEFRQGNSAALQAFGRHVHWGYWETPSTADGSIADFAAAAEHLCQRVCDAGGVRENLRVLDCGCGFGGTIASLNERFSPLQLVGLNIDPRQIARAREQVQPRSGNQIEFIEADACELPFDDASFDLVLAVECIFHFPSRERFFQQARRVLRTGGKLAICDIVPRQMLIPSLKLADRLVQSSVANTFGVLNPYFSVTNYQNLAKKTGFSPLVEEDITINTLPTYPVVSQLIRHLNFPDVEKITSGLEWLSRLGVIRYIIFSWEASDPKQ